MTKQILAFLFCFTRELNPYSPLGARTQNPHPPRELKPLPSPSAHPWCKDLSKKFHYNKNVVTTKPTRVIHLFVINTQTFSELIHELLNILYLLNILNILYILYTAFLINPTL